MIAPTHRLVLFFALSSLLLLITSTPVAISLSFNYTSFDASAIAPTCSSKKVKSICLLGDAAVGSDGAIQLTTPEQFSGVGKVSYTQPVRLWDKTSGAVADFTTTFSFTISNDISTAIADGIAFFLARYPSHIPDSSAGGYLGLVSSSNAFNASGNLGFVAVEFDSFMNDWDPSSNHMGIDVNSVRSAVTADLDYGTSFLDVATGKAQVRYSSKAKRIRASLDFEGRRLSVTHLVDLKSTLPEWVSIGFSGTTGSRAESNKILSWSFQSTL